YPSSREVDDRLAIESGDRESEKGENRRRDVHEAACGRVDASADIRSVEEQEWCGLIRPPTAKQTASCWLLHARDAGNSTSAGHAKGILLLTSSHVDGCDHPARCRVPQSGEPFLHRDLAGPRLCPHRVEHLEHRGAAFLRCIE